MVRKLAIFGGTGVTGSCVVEYALSKGNIVHNKENVRRKRII